MDNWIVQQVSFWVTVHRTNPANIVDWCINFYLDITVPGRGLGENNWIMRGVRCVQQSAERTQAEIDIRNSLRRWDNEFPEIHHEILVRWAVGALVSVCASSVYQSLKQSRDRRC